jgi:hypothetical protein
MELTGGRMEQPRMSRSVRRITVLQKDASGTVTPVTAYQAVKTKKKSTRLLRPIETAVRRWAQATQESANSYVARHQESNQKKRDGWIRDLNVNAVKATRKGAKRLKINRWFGL